MSNVIKLVPKPAPKWYELDRIVRYRDPIGLVGFILLVSGVWMFSRGGACVVAGTGLLALSWFMARAFEASKDSESVKNKIG